MPIEYLDRAQPGWFVVDVMKATARKLDWVALMVNFDPNDPRLKEGCPLPSDARERRLRIPGKHRNKDAAWDVLRDMMETRH